MRIWMEIFEINLVLISHSWNDFHLTPLLSLAISWGNSLSMLFRENPMTLFWKELLTMQKYFEICEHPDRGSQ
jgi:hypothetical protein